MSIDAPDWSTIPAPQDEGAARHLAGAKLRFGVDQLFGLSTQDSVYQCEAAKRLHLPFALLSDEHLRLTRALNLPTFGTSGMTLLKRFTLVIDEGRTNTSSTLSSLPIKTQPTLSIGCRQRRVHLKVPTALRNPTF